MSLKSDTAKIRIYLERKSDVTDESRPRSIPITGPPSNLSTPGNPTADPVTQLTSRYKSLGSTMSQGAIAPSALFSHGNTQHPSTSDPTLERLPKDYLVTGRPYYDQIAVSTGPDRPPQDYPVSRSSYYPRLKLQLDLAVKLF
jgi:hypothetical protein